MIPNKELQELARALLNTSEYTEMIKSRKKILDNSVLGRRMLAFEKEQSRLINSNMAPAAVTEQLNKLQAEYKDFLDHSDVENFVNTAYVCQKMIDNCFIMLNEAIEIHNSNKY